MRILAGSVGLCFGVLAACSAPVGSGGSGGGAAFGGAGGAAAMGGTAGSAGAAGTGPAATGGYGAIGGYGGVGGVAAAGGYGGVGGLVLDAGVQCVPGMRCNDEGPDGEGCGTLTLNADVEETITPGNLLVVFDRSGSMDDVWGTSGVPKWQAAKDALANALAPIADRLTVGAILFPTIDCIAIAGSVAPISDPSNINFMPGPQFLQAWAQKWNPPVALGVGTPVSMAFDAASTSLATSTLTGTTAVVLFTDGAPTDVGLCPPYQMLSSDRAGQFAQMGVKTYVVGLPGAGGVQVLRDIAIAGQTTDYITPDNPTVLAQQLATIASSTISVGFDSCSITLDPPAEAPDELQLVVTQNGMELGVDRDLQAGGGWSITADGSQVEIFGQLCEEAKAGAYTSLEFKFGCVDLPPLPPPMPPD